MTDNGTPGTLDLLGITIYDGTGALAFSSNWSGTASAQKNLGAGNIVVH